MADRGRGGYRKPANPAAVSPPRSGLRTDGGAGDKQPIRTPTGGTFGEASALESQQQGAPLEAGGPSAATPGGVPSAEGAAAPPVDIFAPTERPNDPIPANVPSIPDVPSADLTLRQLVSQYPSPWMMRLLRQRGV